MQIDVQDRKLVQLLNYFAHKDKSKTINKLKAIKLVWVADRYHLRKYGRLVSADEYYALKFGPVGSQLKNIAEQDSFLPDSYVKYSKKYIEPTNRKLNIKALSDVESNLLSQTDLEALEFAWKNFGSNSGFDIANISHKYPEWAKFKEVIESGQVAREKIELLDFFEDSEDITEDAFEMDKDILKSSKEIFIQNRKIDKALAL